ncbi:MAG: hypothetical protein FOGNACKC_00179 [Anaerolineae bacterium]|nr:hypothetical protein [Anaerolineae bacterium]
MSFFIYLAIIIVLGVLLRWAAEEGQTDHHNHRDMQQ